MTISHGVSRFVRCPLALVFGIALAQSAAALEESPAGTLVADSADGAVEFRVLDSDGDLVFDVQVTGAMTGNGLYLDIVAIDCTAAGSPGSLVVDLAAATTTTTTSANAGTLTRVGRLPLDFSGIGNLAGGPGSDTFVLNADLSGLVDGGPGADRIVGTSSPNAFVISANDGGAVNATSFANVENLAGGADVDTFTFTAALSGVAEGAAGDDVFDIGSGGNAGALNGGLGSDTVIAPSSANTFTVDAADAGTVNGIAFSSVENLAGGPAADQFTFTAALSGSVSGSAGDDTAAFNDGGSAGAFDGGAGSDTLSYAGATGPVTLSTNTLVNVENLLGSANAGDLLVATGAGDAVVVTATNAGSVNGLDFSGFENIDGGAGADTFTFAGALSGSASGGAGDDLFDLGSGGGAGSFDGGAGSDTLVGSAAANTFAVSSTDAGTVNGSPFSNIENLTGGAASDTFAFQAGLSGTARGGGGDDIFDVAPNLPVSIAGGADNDRVIINGPSATNLSLVGIENVTYIPERVVFIVRGTVNSVAGDLAAAFSVGDDFELRYTFEARAADSQPSGDLGVYDAVTGVALTIDDYSANLAVSGLRRISVQDDLNGIDRYRVDLSGVSGAPAAGLPLAADQFPVVLLTDFTGAALADDNLPVQPLDVGDFGQNDFLALRFERPDTTTALVLASVDSFEVSPAYRDVPASYWAASFISTLGENRLTSGCGLANFCPEGRVTRAQMAVFLERGIRGGDFVPPAASGNVFLDVGAQDFAAAFIEQLASDGITGGCGGNNFCPNDFVTRAQMAVFLLRARYGQGYLPPPPQGIFADVDAGYWAAAWIEQLFAEGITSGCGGGNYCPDAPTTRAQMAVFLVRTFEL